MTGHVRRRGKSSWELKFDLGTDPLTGKRLTRYHSFKGTKRDAQTEMTRLMAAADAGNYIDPSKATLAEYLDRWEHDWAIANVGPKTIERYRELLKNHVRPHIGAVRLQKLRPVNLSELYAKLLREGRGSGQGLSARTVGHVHRVLHKALVVAAEWGLIQQNAADVAKPPPATPVEIGILTEDQVGQVLRALRGRSLYPIAALALATGMRRGELLALAWCNVDLASGKLRVERRSNRRRPGFASNHQRRNMAGARSRSRFRRLPNCATIESPNRNSVYGLGSGRCRMTRSYFRIWKVACGARMPSRRNGRARQSVRTCPG
jgi:integrase